MQLEFSGMVGNCYKMFFFSDPPTVLSTWLPSFRSPCKNTKQNWKKESILFFVEITWTSFISPVCVAWFSFRFLSDSSSKIVRGPQASSIYKYNNKYLNRKISHCNMDWRNCKHFASHYQVVDVCIFSISYIVVPINEASHYCPIVAIP